MTLVLQRRRVYSGIDATRRPKVVRAKWKAAACRAVQRERLRVASVRHQQPQRYCQRHIAQQQMQPQM